MTTKNYRHPEGEPITMELHEFSQFYRGQAMLLKRQIEQKRDRENPQIKIRMAKPNRHRFREE